MTAEEQKVIDDAAAAKALADKKVEFSTEQQTAISKIFDTRFAKITSKHEDEKKAIADQLAAALAEVETLKATKKKEGTSDDTDAEKKQFRDLLSNEKSQTAAAKAALAAKETESTSLKNENLRIRKEVAIQNASSGRFLNAKVLMTLTQDNIEWDEDTKTFIVRENGIVRQNSSLQNMTLQEYFEDFGKQHPYLVRSDAVGGAGSSENAGAAGSNIGVVRTKADLKSYKDKSAYITKFGLPAFEALPIK